jgi:hypothetical protein
VLIVHGLIHLMYFLVYSRLATIEAVPYSTLFLSGSLEMGDVGVRSTQSGE